MPLPFAYLFVPGDNDHKMHKAAGSNAGAIIFDLEDSVTPARKDEALRTTRDFLASADPAPPDTPEFWVRLNTDAADRTLAELTHLPLDKLAGIFYPKLSSHAQLLQIGHWLDALETRDGISGRPTQIVGIITESAASLVGENASSLARGHPRLRGYTWGVEDLSADLGRAPTMMAADRQIAESAQLHCRYMAAAAGTAAIDSISTAIKEPDKLARACDTACALGYTAKMAIHPAQVGVINAHMAPDAKTIEWAHRVQALVDENPDRSVFSLDGHMVDRPHIEAARQILARAGQHASNDSTER